MSRNIPNKYSQDQLLQVLDEILARGQDYGKNFTLIFIKQISFTLLNNAY